MVPLIAFILIIAGAANIGSAVRKGDKTIAFFCVISTVLGLVLAFLSVKEIM